MDVTKLLGLVVIAAVFYGILALATVPASEPTPTRKKKPARKKSTPRKKKK